MQHTQSTPEQSTQKDTSNQRIQVHIAYRRSYRPVQSHTNSRSSSLHVPFPSFTALSPLAGCSHVCLHIYVHTCAVLAFHAHSLVVSESMLAFVSVFAVRFCVPCVLCVNDLPSGSPDHSLAVTFSRHSAPFLAKKDIHRARVERSAKSGNAGAGRSPHRLVLAHCSLSLRLSLSFPPSPSLILFALLVSFVAFSLSARCAS